MKPSPIQTHADNSESAREKRTCPLCFRHCVYFVLATYKAPRKRKSRVRTKVGLSYSLCLVCCQNQVNAV